MAVRRDTGKLLAKLRSLMTYESAGRNLKAYIVPSSDAHGSEYLAAKDKRRQLISGFTGSSGTALVTADAALLWTDGRYYQQAAQELDSNWRLMRDGLAETPSIADWLVDNVPVASQVGIDATLYEEDMFVALSAKLAARHIELKHVSENLVDLAAAASDQQVEAQEESDCQRQPLIVIPIEYAGESTRDKLRRIREQMRAVGTESYVVTSLDEIAWLLNMRGDDIPFGAVFFAYCLVTTRSCKLFTDVTRLTNAVRAYLLAECEHFEFYPYEHFYEHFGRFVDEVSSAAGDSAAKIFLASWSNHAIHSMVPARLVHKDLSLIVKSKIVKNESEIAAARRVHARDSLVLVEFLCAVDKHFDANSNQRLPDSVKLDEFGLAKCVDEMRAQQGSGFLRPSFETICAFGANGSVIHYKPEEASAKQVEAGNLLLLDSGGHYQDMGTTDVTRTVFLGHESTISAYQRECFTRVLKGHIQLSSRVFPSGTRSELLDSFARQALWQAGLDYRHGTGHGVGALLNVHEVPIIANKRSVDIGLQRNMIVTIEPGYYEDGHFGIRIENCVLIVAAETKFKHAGSEFVRFEPLTYVPIQRQLIDVSLLSADEIQWINDYHARCVSVVGDELKRQNKADIYNWLIEQTKPI